MSFTFPILIALVVVAGFIAGLVYIANRQMGTPGASSGSGGLPSEMICPRCHERVRPETNPRSDQGWVALLFTLGLIPGVGYLPFFVEFDVGEEWLFTLFGLGLIPGTIYLFVRSDPGKRCSSCEHEALIPTNSRRAESILDDLEGDADGE